jgi:hypothetical protein
MGRRDKHTVAVDLKANTRNLNRGYAEARKSTDALTRKMVQNSGMRTKEEIRHQRIIERSRRNSFQREMRQLDRKIRANRRAAREQMKALRAEEQAVRKLQRAKEQANRTRLGQARARRDRFLGGGRGAGRSMLGAGAALVGGVGLYSALETEKRFQQELLQLRLNANKGMAWVGPARKEITDISNQTGIAKDQLTAFAKSYTALTGNVDVAMGSLKEFAEISMVTGSNMGDLAAILDKLNQAGIKGQGIKDTLNIFLQQTKMGSITMEKVSMLLPSLMPSIAKFGAGGKAGAKDLGAVVQLAARGFSGDQPQQVGTAVQSLLAFTGAKRKKIEKKLGIKLADERGGKLVWKSIAEMMKLIGQGVSKNPKVMAEAGRELFGRIGVRVAEQLGKAYTVGWTKKVGDVSSAQALFGATGRDAQGRSAIAKDVKEAYKSNIIKYQKSVVQIQNMIAEFIAPAFGHLAKVFKTMQPYIKWAIKHWKEIAVLFAGLKLAQFVIGLRALMTTLRAQGGAAGGVGGIMRSNKFAMGVGSIASAGAFIGDKYLNQGTEFSNEKTGLGGMDAAAGAIGMTGVGAPVALGYYLGKNLAIYMYKNSERHKKWLADMEAMRKTHYAKMLELEKENSKGRLKLAKVDWYESIYGTIEGAEFKKTTEKVAERYTSYDPETGKRTFDIGRHVGKDPTKVKALRDRLKSLFERGRELATGVLRGRGEKVTEENLRKIMGPSFDMFKNMVTSLDKFGAQVVKLGKQAANPKIVVVTDRNVRPGERSTNTSKPTENYGPTARIDLGTQTPEMPTI